MISRPQDSQPTGNVSSNMSWCYKAQGVNNGVSSIMMWRNNDECEFNLKYNIMPHTSIAITMGFSKSHRRRPLKVKSINQLFRKTLYKSANPGVCDANTLHITPTRNEG
ncbi:hypothetical protein CEXT_68161 [Caerostris extrusa]|uniref:Uncharacterized protein n=1 Tax=Caerostris extrusa TaxID=172846 RepID=A0AAV4Y6C5_CAEEX|nr:hypothetical protein CEXT_68161 [Caerostris extrusa]